MANSTDEITQGPLSSGPPALSDDLELFTDRSLAASRPPPSQLDKAAADLRRVAGEQNGFWPHFFATAAALKGDFRPAIQLDENKRMTAIGAELVPHVGKINQLMNVGDFKQAQEYVDTLAGAVGPRAKEMIPLFQQMMTRVADRQQRVETQRAIIGYQLAQMPEDASPVAKQQAQALKAIAKGNIPIEPTAFNSMMLRNAIHTQPYEGQMLQFNQATGQYSLMPVQHVAQMEQLRGTAGDLLSSAYGRSKDELVNMLNGVPIPDNTGQPMTFTPEQRAQLRTDLSRFNRIATELDIGPKTPITPQYAEDLMNKAGYSNVEIAMRRRLGKNELLAAGAEQPATPYEVAAGQKQPAFGAGVPTYSERELMLTLAKERAQLDLPIMGSHMGLAGAMVFDRDTGTPQPNMTYNQAQESKGKSVVLGPESTKNMYEVARIVDRLNLVGQVIANLPRSNDPMGRVGSFVDRELNARLGVNPSLTFDQVLQTIAKDDIERYFNSRNISVSRYKHLTDPLTSSRATVEGGLETLKGLRDELERDAQRLMQQDYGQESLPSRIRVNVPETPPTAPAAPAQPVPAPGPSRMRLRR